jgi:hypothetical protein
MFADGAEGTRDAIARVDDRGSMFYGTLGRHFTRFAPVSIVPPVFHTNSSVTYATSSWHLTPSLNITINHTTKNLRKTNLTLLRFPFFLTDVVFYNTSHYIYMNISLSYINTQTYLVYHFVTFTFCVLNCFDGFQSRQLR